MREVDQVIERLRVATERLEEAVFSGKTRFPIPRCQQPGFRNVLKEELQARSGLQMGPNQKDLERIKNG